MFGFIITIATLFISAFFIESVTNLENFYFLIISYSVLGIFPLIWFSGELKKQGKTFSDIVYIKGFRDYIQPIIILTITLIIFSLGAFWLFGFVLSNPFPGYIEVLLQEDIIFPTNGILIFLMAFYICILGPFVEEFIFRGLLLKRIAKKSNIIISIFVTNILFAIMHGDIIGSFVFGFIASLLYLLSGNLLVPIAIHVLNNTFATLLIIFDPPLPSFLYYGNIIQLRGHALPHIIILAITIPIIAFYIRKYSTVLSKENR